MGVVDDLVAGREAFDRREWAVARDRLSGSPDLAPDDLEALALAAYLCGDRDTCVDAWQRAYQAHTESGATERALRDAFWIALVLLTAGQESLGGAWVARAARILESEPADSLEHAYLEIHLMYRHIFSGEFPQALEFANRITEAGRRFGEANLLAMGLSSTGRLLIYGGEVRQGLSLLDEAMLCVTEGALSPIIAGMAYCAMIEGCQELGDFRRMIEWTSALTRWCRDQPDLVPFTGQCAVHRAQIMRSHGDYEEALTELRLAVERYQANGMDPAIGLATYERGEVLRLRGDHEAAAAAYDEAAAQGHEPQPGLALLWLASGRVSAAAAAVRRLLGEYADPVHRSQVLPAAVEIFLADSDPVAAGTAADELDAIAASFECPSLTARAACARGAVILAAGDPAGALPALRRGWQLWQELGGRYDAARARTRIGLAFRALGDEDSAASELVVAKRTFTDLDARTDVRTIDQLLTPTFPDGLTAREVEVLRLVADGQTNPQIAKTLFLSEKTVARHLSNIFGKIQVSSRTGAATYAHEHQLR